MANIQIDEDTTQEVPADNLKLAYESEEGAVTFSPEQVQLAEDEKSVGGLLKQEQVDNIVQKRVSRERDTLRKKLKEDDEFFQEAANERGIEFREDGKPKGSIKDEKLNELKQKAKERDDFKEKLQTYEQELEDIRQTKLENNVLQHTDNVKEDLRPAFKKVVMDEMTYSERDNQWVRTDENGDIVTDTYGDPVGVEGVIEDVKDNYPSFFKSTEMKGGTSDTMGEPNPSGQMTREQFRQEVKKAEGNAERLRELEKLADEGKVKG
jgi:hypothetical protein